MQRIIRHAMVLCLVFFSFGYTHPLYEGNFDATWQTLFPGHGDKASLLIDSVTFSADIPFEKAEFYYLSDIKPGTVISPKEIATACQNLKNKKRFSCVAVDLTCEQGHKNLHFTLCGAWIFKTLTISGIPVNKNEYEALYRQQTGDFFNGTKHESSLTTLKQALADHGFFNCQLKDTLQYSKKYKIINVQLHVKLNKRFSIKDVQFFDHKKQMSDWTNEIFERFASQLIDKYYEKNSINKTLERIRKQLKKQGYMHPRIVMHHALSRQTNKVALQFFITRGQRHSFTIQGNSALSTKQILEDIIGHDNPEWLFNPDIITEQLIHDYYKQGYWNAQVEVDNNDGQYTFIIDEGDPVIIDAIIIENELENKEIDLFPLFNAIIGKHYHHQAMANLLEELYEYYTALGFWDVKIQGPYYEKNASENSYTARFIVTKGIQRFWAGYALQSNNDNDLHLLFKPYAEVPCGECPFNYHWIQEQQQLIAEYYNKRGYWYADAQVTLAPLPNQTQTPGQVYIKAIWNITPGAPVQFGKTILQGTTTIPFKRIINEVALQEGDIWDRKKLDRVRKRLKQLDIFKAVQLHPTDVAQRSSKKSINLILIEDDPIEIRARAGYFYTSKNFAFKRASTPQIGASCIIRNPTNIADKLMFDIDWTRFERKYMAEYQQPSIGLAPLLGKIKLYSHKYLHPLSVASGESAYEASQHGILMSISQEYQPNYFWGLTVGNEWMRTDRVRGFLNLNPHLIERTIPSFFIEPSMIIDQRDDHINTTSGYLGFCSFKLTIPEFQGAITASLLTEHSLFSIIYTDRIILAARIRVGHIFRRTFNNIMPIERFYLGGAHSVRGYEKDTLPPLGVTEKDADGTINQEYIAHSDRRLRSSTAATKEYTIQGGSSMFNLNLELRLRLCGSLGAVFFHDLGILSQSGFTDFRETLYPTSGVGIRYQTPIGALRFDIGWKWKKILPQESPYAWYLTIGQAF